MYSSPVVGVPRSRVLICCKTLCRINRMWKKIRETLAKVYTLARMRVLTEQITEKGQYQHLMHYSLFPRQHTL